MQVFETQNVLVRQVGSWTRTPAFEEQGELHHKRMWLTPLPVAVRKCCLTAEKLGERLTASPDWVLSLYQVCLRKTVDGLFQSPCVVTSYRRLYRKCVLTAMFSFWYDVLYETMSWGITTRGSKVGRFEKFLTLSDKNEAQKRVFREKLTLDTTCWRFGTVCERYFTISKVWNSLLSVNVDIRHF